MTPNKEDYLKCIYELGQYSPKITNKQVAEQMAVSAPAASEMLKKLLAEELIQKERALGYQLTNRGQDLVNALYRKHRLLEVFLVHHLHYTTDEIHQEAEVLEHTVSDTFIDRLEVLLDFPTTCPHGGTIPKKGQPFIEQHQQTLAATSQLGTYQLVRIQDFYQLIQYLELHQLAIGDCFELRSLDTFAQTFEIAYKERQLTIPDVIARQLYIKPQDR